MISSAPTPVSWWHRNWQWLVPAGCLALLLVVAGCVAILVTIIGRGMKSSGAYTESVSRAASDCAIQDLLGRPIEAGWFTSGNISVNGSSGQADLSIPLSGPKGKGTLYVTAHKTAGTWSFEVLQFAPKDGGERMDLLAPHRPRCM